MSSRLPRLVDIGSNLGDPVFRGTIRGKQAHPDDFDAVLDRAQKANVVAQILTGVRKAFSDLCRCVAQLVVTGLSCRIGTNHTAGTAISCVLSCHVEAVQH